MAADKRMILDIIANDKTKAAFNTIRKGLSTLGSAAKTVGISIGVTGIAAGVMIKKMVNAIDETGKLSRQLGISVKDLESFKLAADLGGSSLQTFSDASKQTSKNVFDLVKRGTGEAKDAFRQLGITTGDLIPIMNDNVAVFDLISNRFSNMEDGAVKTATAVKLFGNTAVQMLNVFEGGSDIFKKTREEAERFGLILTETQVKAVERANDEFTRLGSVITGIVKQITGELFPALGDIAKELRETVLLAIEDNFESVSGFAKAIADKVRDFSENSALSIIKAAKIISVGFLQFSSIAIKFLDSFIGVADFLVTSIDSLVNVIQNWNPISGALSLNSVDDPKMARGMFGFNTLTNQKNAAPANRESPAKTTEASSIKSIRSGLRGASESIESSIESMNVFFEDSEKWLEDFNAAEDKAAEASAVVNENLLETNELLDESDKKVKTVSVTMERLANASDEFGSVIAKNFEDAIFKAKSFEEALSAVADQLLKIAFQKTVTDPLSAGLSSFIGGMFGGGGAAAGASAGGGSGLVTGSSGVMMAAKGAAFSQGRLIPFAKGGIVSSPTLFPMRSGTGIMGEAGAEAVMPLSRGAGGRLGVDASNVGGGSAIVNVNVIDQRSKGKDVEVREGRDSQGNRQISVMIRDEVRRGFADGSFDKPMSAIYGITRGGTRSA